ncbi:MAG TPA: capsid cement protein [Steroidobacteraceae bacterium]|nr:capsid cement protein [Steroidobacteraceae bacterium]
MNPLLIKRYTANAAIAASRIVKFDNADQLVIQAAAATDLSVGVSVETIGADSGEGVDVIHAGIAYVEAGGNVTRGAKVTSDASGKAVAAAPAAGSNAQVIGVALVSAVSGDIFPVLISPQTMQG